jgi:hypothetical protein
MLPPRPQGIKNKHTRVFHIITYCGGKISLLNMHGFMWAACERSNAWLHGGELDTSFYFFHMAALMHAAF